MQDAILAGGLITRMHPATWSTPGSPFLVDGWLHLQHQVELLRAAGASISLIRTGGLASRLGGPLEQLPRRTVLNDQRAKTPPRTKVAIVMPDGFSLWQHRRVLISTLVKRGYDVTAISDDRDSEYVERVKQLGVSHITVRMNQTFSPLHDIRYLAALFLVFRRRKFDVVHTLNTKPNAFGILAARAAGATHVVGNVDGLGRAFSPGVGARLRAHRCALLLLYFLAGLVCERMLFMNPDDQRYFLRHHLIRKAKCVLIRGTGIDTAHFFPRDPSSPAVQRLRAEIAGSESCAIVLMPSRAMWLKGVREFIEAARIIARDRDYVCFLLAGDAPADPDGVPPTYLRENESNSFRWLGFRSDINELYAAADVVVLPSRYREGLPTVLLEAMATGKPLVTTDNVGCRETVEHGSNGFLVPPGNAQALAAAVLRLVEDVELRRAFGLKSRQKLEREFDADKIASRIISELYRVAA